MKRPAIVALILLAALAYGAWAIWRHAPVAAANHCTEEIRREIREYQRDHWQSDPWEFGAMTQIDSPAGDIITRQAVTIYPVGKPPVTVEFVCVGASQPLLIGELPR